MYGSQYMVLTDGSEYEGICVALEAGKRLM